MFIFIDSLEKKVQLKDLVLLTMNVVKMYHPDLSLSNSQNIDRVTVFISAAPTAHPTTAKIARPLIQKSPY